MTALFFWFIESKVGRMVAAAGAALAAIAIMLWKVFSAGKQSAADKAQKQVIHDVQLDQQIHQDVQRMPPSAVDDELRKWSRPR